MIVYLLLYVALLIFAGAVQARPFAWQSDPFFKQLEQQFSAARDIPATQAVAQFDTLAAESAVLIATVKNSGHSTPYQALAKLKSIQFRMAFITAAHEALLPKLQHIVAEIRREVMNAAQRWKLDSDNLHDALYRVIYGGRAAIEEAWVQSHSQSLQEVWRLNNAPSPTPSAMVEGVRIHSGDIVLSRAGAPTSALISRGNDYPGNFSHVALVYVDPQTHEPTIIESLIEKGVVLTSMKQFFKDKKQRILVLRLRADHPRLRKDPMLPHKAAAAMLAKVKGKHFGYDFKMDWQEDREFSCSEVPYHAYMAFGVDLWGYRTTMTSPGLRAWLAGMGVTHFTTLAPSDLEYDPKLFSVVEWRDRKVLKTDRVDNAIMDALLEEAELGLRLGYPGYKLPLAGLVKLFSPIQSLIGVKRTIPEGLRADSALQVDGLVNKVFPALRMAMAEHVAGYRSKHGFEPPYWSLLEMAEEVVKNKKKDLFPYLRMIHPERSSNAIKGWPELPSGVPVGLLSTS